MSRQVLIGFDSAWTDNLKNPGAICALISDREGDRFLAPRLASFDQATAFVSEVSRGADYLLVAVDQPTVVPNETGCRPVERVAASLISRLGGGVQPARRGGGGVRMFGDGAPIWRFLNAIGGAQDPFEARSAERGNFVMEVFPALALPALVPEIWDRGRAAKYNPAARLYAPADWQVVTVGVADAARAFGLDAAADFAADLCAKPGPTKADQDCLDALLCLLIAASWRKGPPEGCMVLGDRSTGSIVTPVSASTRRLLEASARQRGVPVDEVWSDSSKPSALPASTVSAMTKPTIAAPCDSTKREVHPSARGGGGKATVAANDLRTFLIGKAKARQLVTYGDVAQFFGFAWTQGFGASLKAALSAVNAENLHNGEPKLMALVVNKESRLPGQRYFDLIGEGAADDAHRRRLLHTEAQRCAEWPWP